MSQKFYQGRTNNHLSWVMVDATDNVSPESALSAATKIKIYGKVRAATGVNFVSSGTGSLTNDIQHVGASVLGLYTIALAKADLSDASAAWYDQYIVSLSATGAAYQALVCEGVLSPDSVSALSGIMSDVLSLLVVANSNASDALSAATLANTNAAAASSRALLNQSRISDVQSYLIAMSATLSDALSAATAGTSQTVLVKSLASDIQSYLVGLSGLTSDVQSNVAAVLIQATAAASRALLVQSVISDVQSALDSDYSDLASKIGGITPDTSVLSDILSAAQQTNSRILLVQSLASDVHSLVVVANSNASNALSAATIGASQATLAATQAAAAASRALLVQSDTGNIYSLLSDHDSNMQSRVPKLVATASQVSDVVSDAISDIKSYLVGLSAILSDAHSAATAGASRATLIQSSVSDVQSSVTAIRSVTDELAQSVKTIVEGTCAALGTTTLVIASSLSPASAVNDQFLGRICIFTEDTTTAALRGQATDITAYVHATKTFTCTALTTAPALGDTFVIL